MSPPTGAFLDLLGFAAAGAGAAVAASVVVVAVTNGSWI